MTALSEWTEAEVRRDGKVYTQEYERGKPLGEVKEIGVSKQTGNVLEWVAAWYDGDYYQNAPSRNPKGPDSGTQHVLRGGSWYNYPGALRSSNRCYDGPAYRVGGIGFRCSQ